MSTLTGESTIAEIQAEADRCASWWVNQDVALAKDYAVACNYMLRRLPTLTKHQSSQVEHDPAIWAKELAKVQQWLATNDTGRSPRRGGVKFADFRDFRS